MEGRRNFGEVQGEEGEGGEAEGSRAEGNEALAPKHHFNSGQRGNGRSFRLTIVLFDASPVFYCRRSIALFSHSLGPVCVPRRVPHVHVCLSGAWSVMPSVLN